MLLSFYVISLIIIQKYFFNKRNSKVQKLKIIYKLKVTYNQLFYGSFWKKKRKRRERSIWCSKSNEIYASVIMTYIVLHFGSKLDSKFNSTLYFFIKLNYFVHYISIKVYIYICMYVMLFSYSFQNMKYIILLKLV